MTSPVADYEKQVRELVQSWASDSTEDGQWLVIGKGKVLIDRVTTALESAREAERSEILATIQDVRSKTVWAYKSHEIIGSVLDDVVHAINKRDAGQQDAGELKEKNHGR